MREPTCPKCETEGFCEIFLHEIVVSDSEERSAWIAYCRRCGHIYGVFGNPSESLAPCP